MEELILWWYRLGLTLGVILGGVLGILFGAYIAIIPETQAKNGGRL
ncbi:MAG: hypothetical protein IJV83_05355 [Clostridia bacterium]|nr:hypothetical protein [Clostridia bacterium]